MMSIVPVVPTNVNCPPILIIGLGNPILGDDGVGWRVAEKVAERFSLPPAGQLDSTSGMPLDTQAVEVDCLSLGGLSLMERMIGYEQAIIIDAMYTGNYPPGAVTISYLADLPSRALGHLCSAHDTTLQNALELGQRLGANLPPKIVVVGIEAHQVFDFTTELSPGILEAIPEAVNRIMELIT